jgi:hypothetical protein
VKLEYLVESMDLCMHTCVIKCTRGSSGHRQMAPTVPIFAQLDDKDKDKDNDNGDDDEIGCESDVAIKWPGKGLLLGVASWILAERRLGRWIGTTWQRRRAQLANNPSPLPV